MKVVGLKELIFMLNFEGHFKDEGSIFIDRRGFRRKLLSFWCIIHICHKNMHSHFEKNKFQPKMIFKSKLKVNFQVIIIFGS